MRTMLRLILLSMAVLIATTDGQIERASREELNDLNPSLVTFDKFFACDRLFTTEGPIGCGSDKDDNGEVGALFHIVSEESLQDLNKVEDIKRSVLVEASLFSNANVINQLAADKNVAGILVAASDSSEDVLFNPSSSSALNPGGNNLLNTLFTQPVVLLSQSETDIVKERIAENQRRSFDNRLWQHAAVMDFYNGKSDVTSKFCLGIDFCDPLGGQSVWGSVGDSPSSGADTILFTVKLDSNALFHDLIFAANDVASSLTVFLGVAEALAPLVSEIGALEKKILFAAFQGETFDSVGSKRFIFDVSSNCAVNSNDFDADKDSCNDFDFLYSTEFNKLNLTDIGEIISLDNVGAYFAEISDFFVHTQNSGDLASELLAEFLTESVSAVEVENAAVLPETPISSFQSFAGFTGESVVIAGYQTDIATVNPALKTRFDRAPRVGEDNDSAATAQLASLTKIIAKTLVKRAAGAADVTSILDEIEVDDTFIRSVEICLTEDFSCDLVTGLLNVSKSFFQNAFQTRQLATNRAVDLPAPPIYYAGVYRPNLIKSRISAKAIEFFVRNFLASRLSPSADSILNISGTAPANVTEVNCQDDLQCRNDFLQGLSGNFSVGTFCELDRPSSALCVAGRCICSTVFYHDAVSPAVRVGGGFGIQAELPVGFESEKVFTEPKFELPIVQLSQVGRNVTEGILLGFGIVFTSITYFLSTWTIKKLKDTKYKLL